MGKIGPKFSHLLTVRAEGADHPPHGQPDHKKTVFLTASHTYYIKILAKVPRGELQTETQSQELIQKYPLFSIPHGSGSFKLCVRLKKTGSTHGLTEATLRVTRPSEQSTNVWPPASRRTIFPTHSLIRLIIFKNTYANTNTNKNTNTGVIVFAQRPSVLSFLRVLSYAWSSLKIRTPTQIQMKIQILV